MSSVMAIIALRVVHSPETASLDFLPILATGREMGLPPIRQSRGGFLGNGRGEISSDEENEQCQEEVGETWQTAGLE